MKTLYLDLSMGAAGDMLTAALLPLTDDPAEALSALNALGVPGVSFTAAPRVRCGVTGVGVAVSVNGVEEDEALLAGHHDHDHSHDHDHDHDHGHDHHHAHTHLTDIERTIRALRAPEPVLEDAVAVYRLLAEAESAVHGEPVEQIHFHEVGTLDAIADVTAVCLLLHLLAPENIVASPVHVGSGTVRCAHGVLPVPAPAAAKLLTGIPTYGGEIKGELCTPTGAALLKHFVASFGPQPAMTVQRIGYGMGKKEFPAANCVRAMLGETADKTFPAASDAVWELACNIDDMTAESLAFAAERLLSSGAADVFLTPILMKKGRPGTMLTVLVKEPDRDRLLGEIFRYTSTLGVRMAKKERAVLVRRSETVETPAGSVRKKISEGFGVTREKIECDDLAAVARAKNLSLDDARKALTD